MKDFYLEVAGLDISKIVIEQAFPISEIKLSMDKNFGGYTRGSRQIKVSGQNNIYMRATLVHECGLFLSANY